MIAKLSIILSAVLVAFSHGQVSVTMKVDRNTYLENEPVTAVVSITNRSGREIFFHSKADGQINRSWLDFALRESGGKTLNRRNHGVFRAAKLPAGQSISRRVNLSSLYQISQQGNFSSNAKIIVNGQTYRSNSTHFTVSSGTVYSTLPFGAPGTKYPDREYRLITFNDGQNTAIYTAVHDRKTKLSLSTSRLSTALLFQRPQATLDGENSLHVLYLSTPEIFVHALINKEGGLIKTEFLKRSAAGVPSFAAFANGEIKVRGGIPYDPSKEAKERAKARTISERRTR
ncbi:hypothetical protein N9051_01575 [Akkermansiaceae bacterium]|nr:hypothetical protein [Akkermansiaceae bacterium]